VKKIWSHIALFFIGVSAGLITMYKLMGEQIEVNIKKVKNKRVGSSEVSIPISIEKADKRAKKRKKRRNEADS
jgi:hypothetical protein